MYKLLLSLGFLFAVFVIPSTTLAAQNFPNYPQPGYNCGVGFPGRGETETSPDMSKPENEAYACCGSEEQLDWNLIPDYLENLPGLGDMFKAMERVTDIFNFPNNFLPIDLFPSLGTLTRAYYETSPACLTGEPIGDPKSNSCYCKLGVTPALQSIIQMCGNIGNDDEKQACQECMGYDPDTRQFLASGGGVWTGIGCVKTTLSSFVSETVFGLGIGLGGLISLGCIIYGAILLQTSQGDPEKIQAARDTIQSCIMGLLLIIFSVFILRVIGVDILRIPGFS